MQANLSWQKLCPDAELAIGAFSQPCVMVLVMFSEVILVAYWGSADLCFTVCFTLHFSPDQPKVLLHF